MNADENKTAAAGFGHRSQTVAALIGDNGLMKPIVAILAFLLMAESTPAQRRSTAGDFSYYMLVLSYAPDFCAEPGSRKDVRECGNGRHTGFVVHGLWPQGEDSRGPERCAPARPVSHALVQSMLSYFPTPGLIQHEWTDHGTCSGLSTADYFTAVRRARDSLKIPGDLDQPSQPLQVSPDVIETRLAAANPNYPREAFRTSCYRDGELQEIRVCLDKNLSPRNCGRSAGECRLPSINMLPVR